MPDARLEVRDAVGERVVVIDRLPFSIGRRETNGLRLGGSEVSREHAEITLEGTRYKVRDLQSRYGTFVNGEPVTSECELHSGDRVRLGRGGGADLVFLGANEDRPMERSSTGARDDSATSRPARWVPRARVRPGPAGGARARPRRGD